MHRCIDPVGVDFGLVDLIGEKTWRGGGGGGGGGASGGASGGQFHGSRTGEREEENENEVQHSCFVGLLLSGARGEGHS